MGCKVPMSLAADNNETLSRKVSKRTIILAISYTDEK